MSFKMVGFRFLFAVSVLCILTAAPTRADFVITGVNEDVAQGSTATVTFMISATTAEALAGFQVELQITGTQGNSNYELQFSPPSSQPNPYNDTNYVFSGNSLDQSPPPPQGSPFWDSVSSSTKGGTIYDLATGGDSTNAGYTSFSASTSYLLATVQIDATNAAVGDTYQIALVPDNGSGSPNATYFQDANNNYTNYSSIAAEITIVSEASAVPAPPSLLLAGIGSLTILLYYRWRTRREVSSSLKEYPASMKGSDQRRQVSCASPDARVLGMPLR